MADFEFELKSTGEWPIPHGFTGDIGPFGAVMVVRPRGKSGEESLRQVFLNGPSFPATEFGGGSGVLPSLDGGWLKVDGTLVYMDLKVKGVRKGSRWLEMTFRDRRYTYTSFGSLKQAQLNRDGVSVTLDSGPWDPEKRERTRFGKVEGDADATDLAIVLVLEEVSKSCLTTSGALMAIPGKVLFGRYRDEGIPGD
ncbi:hypothetical protein [Streptomyces sp. NPDC094437]|uniref:hypothetical protein n=1 Tax=Streptomyces sp. NPDC094437 TaxID=3366060 RepID=UPI0038168328